MDRDEGEEAVKALIDALTFYAEEENWKQRSTGFHETNHVELDRGSRAKMALAQARSIAAKKIIAFATQHDAAPVVEQMASITSDGRLSDAKIGILRTHYIDIPVQIRDDAGPVTDQCPIRVRVKALNPLDAVERVSLEIQRGIRREWSE